MGEGIPGRLVRLAPLRAQDKELMFGWINDRSNVLWNASFKPVHEHSHSHWYEQLQVRSDLAIFGIHSISPDRLVGTCQLHSIDPVHRSAELQIRIGVPDQHGQGLGSEAVRLLVRFGFDDLNLHRIYLHVFDDNSRAIRVYERNGFRTEGVAREAVFVDGRYTNVQLMGLLRSDDVPGTGD